MSILNKRDCAIAGANTGYGDCFINLQNIVGGILVPTGRVYTEAELASADTLLAAIEADILAAASLRAYPMGTYVGITDNTEAPTRQTFGYGGIATVKEGFYNLSFQFIEGGLCLSNSLRKFNSSNKAVILWDNNGVLAGWKVGTGLKGIPLEMFYQSAQKLNDGSNVTAYITDLVFQKPYLNELIGFVQMSIGDLNALRGLQNIVLYETTGSNLPILKIKAKTGCNGFDLYDTYSSELADDALWTAVNDNGEPIAITSVVVDATLKAWTVTVDASDPNYPTSGGVLIGLASALDLFNAGIEGFEGIPVLTL
jgi:hypothetical protein